MKSEVGWNWLFFQKKELLKRFLWPIFAILLIIISVSFVGCEVSDDAGDPQKTISDEMAPNTTESSDRTDIVTSSVNIGTDGYFYINGAKSVVFGIEEERRIFTPEEVDQLIPRLKEMGITFIVIYKGNPQEDFFYEKLEAANIYIAQDLGNVKKLTGDGFPGTGGVIGTVPDEETIQNNLAWINETVSHLSVFNNILFWWMGGEFVELEFHTEEGKAATIDSIRRYAEAIRSLDSLKRPFTVSHHYVEALESPVLAYLDYSDITDFTWYTVATHMHACDFGTPWPLKTWTPLLQYSEGIIGSILTTAYNLNHQKPIFFGGVFGDAPPPSWPWVILECKASEQYKLLKQKWNKISPVPHSGSSMYHLDEWNDNNIPHALFERTANDWVRTVGGQALAEIIAGAN